MQDDQSADFSHILVLVLFTHGFLAQDHRAFLAECNGTSPESYPDLPFFRFMILGHQAECCLAGICASF